MKPKSAHLLLLRILIVVVMFLGVDLSTLLDFLEVGILRYRGDWLLATHHLFIII